MRLIRWQSSPIQNFNLFHSNLRRNFTNLALCHRLLNSEEGWVADASSNGCLEWGIVTWGWLWPTWQCSIANTGGLCRSCKHTKKHISRRRIFSVLLASEVLAGLWALWAPAWAIFVQGVIFPESNVWSASKCKNVFTSLFLRASAALWAPDLADDDRSFSFSELKNVWLIGIECDADFR